MVMLAIINLLAVDIRYRSSINDFVPHIFDLPQKQEAIEISIILDMIV